MDIKKKVEEPLRRMSSESGKALKELSISLMKMTKSSSSDIHVFNSQSACKVLSSLVKSRILNDVEPLQLISLMTTVSLLIDIVNLTEKISESVQDLAFAARFMNKMKPTVLLEKSSSRRIGRVMSLKSHHDDDDHVVKILQDVDTSDNDDQSCGESSLDSCHHGAIKIVDDDDSIIEKHEDGEAYLHTSWK